MEGTRFSALATLAITATNGGALVSTPRPPNAEAPIVSSAKAHAPRKSALVFAIFNAKVSAFARAITPVAMRDRVAASLGGSGSVVNIAAAI